MKEEYTSIRALWADTRAEMRDQVYAELGRRRKLNLFLAFMMGALAMAILVTALMFRGVL